MQMKIGLIPLDDRPPCRLFPVELGAVAGIEVEVPPKALMGDEEGLIGWVKTARAGWDLLIFSADQIAYGGLVASRELKLSTDEAKGRLVKFMSALEPKTIPVWSFASCLKTFPKEKPKLRSRNHKINQLELLQLKEQKIDLLVIGLDDCRPMSATAFEAAALEKEAGKLKLENFHLYPGLDEIAASLVSRAAWRDNPAGIEVKFFPTKGKNSLSLYEDRKIGELLKPHLKLAGGTIDKKAPRGKLFISAPGAQQTEAATQKPRKAGRLPLVKEIKAALEQKQPFALADLVYANGADRSLMELLAQEKLLAKLSGFSAWNTAGNALGSTIAHFLLRLKGLEGKIPPLAHHKFLLERYLDDWLYQGELRQKAKKQFPEPGDSLPWLKEELEKAAKTILKNFSPRYRLGDLKLSYPWNRYFEIEIEAEIK